MKTSRIEHEHARYLPLLWPVQQLGAAVEHNDVILNLDLHTASWVVHTPINHVSLVDGAPT